MAKIIVSHSESETTKLGRAIGELLQPATVIGLNGTLGAGKTRLTQAVGLGLDIEDGNVVSPTYTICTPHEGRLIFLHLDAYRIEHDEEVDELGLDEMVEAGAVLIIEWAERIEALLPPIDLIITVEPVDESSRQFSFDPKSDLGNSLVNEIMGQLEKET